MRVVRSLRDLCLAFPRRLVEERELPCMRIAATEPHTVQEGGRPIVSFFTVPFRPAAEPYPMTAEGLLAFAAAHRNGWTARSPSPGAPHESCSNCRWPRGSP